MIELIAKHLENKKILILGYGREGKSSYNFIKKYVKYSSLGIADQNQLQSSDFDEDVVLYCGENYLESTKLYDIILKAPGVPIKNKISDEEKRKISSQTDLFLKYCSNKIIGVTATKGKSTTSSLIYHILSKTGKNAVLIGNIGVPCFSVVESLTKDTIVVFELSSHQLEYVHNSPNISVLLNIFSDHLDHYNSWQDYADSKKNIYKFQTENDYVIYNGDCENIIKSQMDEAKSTAIEVSYNSNRTNNSVRITDDSININIDGASTVIKKLKINTKLLGEHNLYNIANVLAVCIILNIDTESALEAIKSFNGLEHRLEFAGVYDGIKFYNDSIATIPQATICAMECFPSVDTLILGGMDRGIDYDDFCKYLLKSSCKNLIFMPDSGNRMAKIISKIEPENNKNIMFAKNMDEAVALAKINTPKDGICLMSPASASYGFYKNFEERGKHFKELLSK